MRVTLQMSDDLHIAQSISDKQRIQWGINIFKTRANKQLISSTVDSSSLLLLQMGNNCTSFLCSSLSSCFNIVVRSLFQPPPPHPVAVPLRVPPPPSDSTPPSSEEILPEESAHGKEVDDRHLEQLANKISETIQKMKGRQMTKPNEDAETSVFSLDNWKLSSSGVNMLKEILDEGNSCVDSLEKYIPKHAEKDVTHAVVPILNDIGSYHWVTSGLFMVGKILERCEKISQNKEECLKLLEEMASLALLLKQIGDGKIDNRNLETMRKTAMEKIFKGYLLCCSKMDSSKIRQFFTASHDKSQLSELRQELDRSYGALTSQMTVCIYDAITCINKPPQRPRNVLYPRQAVGIENQIKEVVRLLEFGSTEKAVAVILHNFGGMGKTTLADAVFSSLHIKEFKYSMVKLFETTSDTPDIKRLQSKIVRDLSGKDMRFDWHEEGQQEIGKILRQSNAFIYIDNVLLSEKSDELRNLLPRDLDSARKVRLLITTRDENVVKTNLGRTCKTVTFNVEGLQEEHVRFLLRKGSKDRLSDNQMKYLVKVCQGVPLLVDLVAAFIASSASVKEAFQVIEGQYEESMRTPMGDRTFMEVFALDTLQEEIREYFLDICCFFVGEDWRNVEIAVGAAAMNMLQSKALVSCRDGEVEIHDVLLDIARKHSRGLRITETSELKQVMQKIDKGRHSSPIKGIRSCGSIEIPSRIVDAHCGSLRILELSLDSNLEGECANDFEKLRYLRLSQCPGARFPFQLEKLPNLKVLFVKEDAPALHLSQLPSSLCSITYPTLAFGDDEGFSRLRNLRVIRVTLSRGVTRLPDSLCCLSNLGILSLDGCEDLQELPVSIGNFVSLETLCLAQCKSLLSLPESIMRVSLETLCLTACESLRSLPESIANLSSLEHLLLCGCTSLERFPDSCSEFPSLQYLTLYRCNIRRLPEKFNCPSLVKLDLCGCDNLEQLPEGVVRAFSSLELIRLSGCKNLQQLPQGFSNLTSLHDLWLCNCEKLKGESLDVILGLASLTELFIDGSEMLIDRWLSTPYENDKAYKTFVHIGGSYPETTGCIEIITSRLFWREGHELSGKQGETFRLGDVEGGTHMLFIVGSSSDEKEISALQSIIKGFRGIKKIIHVGDKCEDWPPEIEDAIVARAPSNSRAHFLISVKLMHYICLSRFVEADGLCVVDTEVCKDTKCPRQCDSCVVKDTFNVLRLLRRFKREQELKEVRAHRNVSAKLKRLLEYPVREAGEVATCKLTKGPEEEEVLLENLDGKRIICLVFRPNFPEKVEKQDEQIIERIKAKCIGREDVEIICTRRNEPSRKFNEWVLKNAPWILLESLKMLREEAALVLLDKFVDSTSMVAADISAAEDIPVGGSQEILDLFDEIS